VFSPFNPKSLQGWHLDSNQHYQPLEPNANGWLWCESLGFWLGTWEGEIDRAHAIWLRFFDRDGNLVLLPEEAAQFHAEQAQIQAEQAQIQAEQEHQRAERLAARLRLLGEDPDTL